VSECIELSVYISMNKPAIHNAKKKRTASFGSPVRMQFNCKKRLDMEPQAILKFNLPATIKINDVVIKVFCSLLLVTKKFLSTVTLERRRF